MSGQSVPAGGLLYYPITMHFVFQCVSTWKEACLIPTKAVKLVSLRPFNNFRVPSQDIRLRTDVRFFFSCFVS